MDLNQQMLFALKAAQSALNQAPRFRVPREDLTDSYKIAAVVDRAVKAAEAAGIEAVSPPPVERVPLPPPPEGTPAVAAGSYGESEFNLDTGELTPPYGEDDGTQQRMTRVDLHEFELAYGRKIRPGEHFDVLDLAGWWDDEWGEAEEDWRDRWAIEHPDDTDAIYYELKGRDAVREYSKTMSART